MKKYILLILFLFGGYNTLNAMQAYSPYTEGIEGLNTFLHTQTMQQRQRNAAIKKARQMKAEARKRWKYASVGLVGALFMAQIKPEVCTENWQLLCMVGLAVGSYFKVF